jgi:hypothetical protein
MSLRDDMPRDDSKRLRLSKEYYLTFRSKVNTYAKNHCGNTVRMGVYLTSPLVDETAYFAMTNPQKAAHAEDDAALGDAIEHVIHFQDAHITAPFGANEMFNAPPPAPQNPSVPTWWPSPSKAALGALRAKFGSITTSAVSLLKAKLMAMKLSDFQGDVPLFEAAFTTLLATYLSAAVSAGINTSSLDQDLALHLVDLFTHWHSQYHTAMSLLRQTMPHTVEEVFEAANIEYAVHPAQKTQQGPTVLQSSADRPVDLVRLLSTVLERLPAPNAPGHRGSGRRDRPPPRDRARTLDPEHRKLYEKCIAAGACFNNAIGKCDRGAKCRYSHSVLANPITFRPDVSVLVTSVSSDDLSLQHEGKHDSDDEDHATDDHVDHEDHATDDGRNHRELHVPVDTTECKDDTAVDVVDKVRIATIPLFSARTPPLDSLSGSLSGGFQPSSDLRRRARRERLRRYLPAQGHRLSAQIGEWPVSRRRGGGVSRLRRSASLVPRDRRDLPVGPYVVNTVVMKHPGPGHCDGVCTCCNRPAGFLFSPCSGPLLTGNVCPHCVDLAATGVPQEFIFAFAGVMDQLMRAPPVLRGLEPLRAAEPSSRPPSPSAAVPTASSNSLASPASSPPSPAPSPPVDVAPSRRDGRRRQRQPDHALWDKCKRDKVCFKHLTGQCQRGARCRYLHVSAPPVLPQVHPDAAVYGACNPVRPLDDYAWIVGAAADHRRDHYIRSKQWRSDLRNIGARLDHVTALLRGSAGVRASASTSASRVRLRRLLQEASALVAQELDSDVSWACLAPDLQEPLQPPRRRAPWCGEVGFYSICGGMYPHEATLHHLRTHPRLRRRRCAPTQATAACEVTILAATSTGRGAADLFVVDTGANGIVVSSIEMIGRSTNFVPSVNAHVRSNAHKDTITGTCTVHAVFTDVGGHPHSCDLTALVVPTSQWNILPPKLIPGFTRATIAADGTITLWLRQLSHPLRTETYAGLQVLRLRSVVRALATTGNVPPTPALTVSPAPSPTMLRLHETLAHAAPSTIHALLRAGFLSCPDPATRSHLLAIKDVECRHCAMASHPSASVTPSGHGHSPSTADAGLWSVDLFGPFEPSAGGNRWCSVWLSHRSNMVFLAFHKRKSDVSDYFPLAAHHMSTAAADEFTVLRSDNGTEFSGLADFCLSQGIRREFTAPGASFQNGRVERVIRTLRARAGASLSRSGLSSTFWAEALQHAAYVINRLPSSRGDLSPYQVAHGTPPSLRLVHPFGCLALARVHQPVKARLATKSRPSVYLGPSPGTKDAHRLIHLDTRSIASNRNCVFFPDQYPLNPTSGPGAGLHALDEDTSSPSALPGSRLSPSDLPNDVNPFARLRDLDEETALALRRVPRVTARPAVFDPAAYQAQRDQDAAGVVANVAVQEECPEQEEPTSLASALRSAQKDKWLAAVASELTSHRHNGTWEVASSVPKGRSPLPSKWVFKVKFDEHGNIAKYKARLVVKGFRQRAEVDYYDTFAPTLRIPTFRTFCGVACANRFVVHTMDVSTAFLVPFLREDIFMVLPEQPIVDEQLPSFASPPVVKLVKTLYGLKQSPREYFLNFCGTLGSLGFVQSTADPCLWTKVSDGVLRAAIAFWVDDCAIAAPATEISEIKAALQRSYTMTDGGLASWFLSVRITHDVEHRRMTLDQGPSIERLLRRHRLADCKPLSTPCDVSAQLSAKQPPADEEELHFMRDKPYRALVGALLYLLFTRPDIAFAVNQLSRYLNAPRRIHWTAAVRVMRYLRGTTNLGIAFCAEEEEEPAIVGWADADWANDKNSRRSTTGFVFMLCGGPIAWKTKLQPSVALSTTEAEIMALAAAFQEALWLRRLAQDFQLSCAESTFIINEDNQGAIALVRDHRFSDRSKHIDIRYFFIREHIEQGAFEVTYCETSKMLADLLTKPLGKLAFAAITKLLGMAEVSV